mmetsp:Transcript_11301/g.47263  ORF Transcript_11301/g.47263 Transcript_11301/m.47263 type:complete len:211 (-) Transcript_11301:738-1370(-)
MRTVPMTSCWWSGERTDSKPSETYGEERAWEREGWAPPGTDWHPRRHPVRHPGRRSSAFAWTSRTSTSPESKPSRAATWSSPGNTSAAPRPTWRCDVAWRTRTVDAMEKKRRRRRVASPASRWPRAVTTEANGDPTSISRFCAIWDSAGTISGGSQGCLRGRATAPRRASAVSSARDRLRATWTRTSINNRSKRRTTGRCQRWKNTKSEG